jgi:uncharacterized protein YjbI with pentapeptide repeats
MPQLVGPVSPNTVAVKPEIWKKLRKVSGYMEEYVKDYKSPEATGFFLAYVTRNPGGEGFHFLSIDGKTVVYKSYGGEGRKYFGQVLQREFNKYFNARNNPDNSYAVISESPRFASSGMSYAEAKEMADSIGGEVVTVEVARAYKQQMLSEKQGSSFYGTGRSGEFRNVRGRWNPAADPLGRYEALRRMADPSGNASANERKMAELLMAKIEAKLGYVPAAPVAKPTRSTGRKGAAKAIAARRQLENSRRNPDYSQMSQADLARAYLRGYATYQEAAADRGYALRKMDEAAPHEEEAARQEFEAAAAVAEKAMHAYNQFFPLLTEETKQKYLMVRAVASKRMDGTSSIQSAPQDVSRVRAMSRRNPELTLKEQYRAYGGIRWFNDKDLMDRYTRGEPPPGGAGSAASSPARAVQQVAAARPVPPAPAPVPVPRAPAPPPFVPKHDVKAIPRASPERAALMADIRDGKYVGGNLRGLDLRGENLYGAKLGGVDLTGANLAKANLTRADLKGANLTEAILKDADLTVTDFTQANLTKANLMGANLTGAHLSFADLKGANLTGADLIRAYITDTSFLGADLTDANLLGAEGFHTVMTGATRTGSIMPDGSTYRAPPRDEPPPRPRAPAPPPFNPKATTPPPVPPMHTSDKATLIAEIRSGRKPDRSLTYVDLENADLRGVNLTNAYLVGANLRGANLSDADLNGARMDNADLSSANMAFADLSYAILTGANLIRANLTRANLNGANLEGANMFNADMTNANLDRAKVTGATMPDGMKFRAKARN